MIESAVPVFQYTTLDCHIEAMVKTKVVTLLEPPIMKQSRRKKSAVYLAVENVVRRVVA